MHGHMYISYYVHIIRVCERTTDNGRMKCVGTVIASIDTAPMYTLHPPVIRAYCSLRFLLSLRSVLACLGNSRAVLFKKFLAPLFRSRDRKLETESGYKLGEVRRVSLDIATNAPFALHENARAVLVANGLSGKVVVYFRQFPALPHRLSPFPDRRSVKGGNFLLVFADCFDGVLVVVHSNAHFPLLIVGVEC